MLIYGVFKLSLGGLIALLGGVFAFLGAYILLFLGGFMHFRRIYGILRWLYCVFCRFIAFLCANLLFLGGLWRFR